MWAMGTAWLFLDFFYLAEKFCRVLQLSLDSLDNAYKKIKAQVDQGSCGELK